MVKPEELTLKPPRGKPVFKNVLELIIERIERGEFVVGERMPSERDFASMFDVSRGSLREALRVLEQQGFVESTPGGGRVLLRSQSLESELDKLHDQLKKSAIDNLLEAREMLDDKIVELAALRATEQDLAKIEEAYYNCCNLPVNGSNPAANPHDRLFHLSIAEAAHNSVFESVYQISMQLLLEIRKSAIRTEEDRLDIIQEHTVIFQAIKARDPLMARLAARIHHRNICLRYKRMKSETEENEGHNRRIPAK